MHTGDSDLALAIADDFHPTAIEESTERTRLFFSHSDVRDAACAALVAARYNAQPIDIDDEDWAMRSQAGLKAVTVGCITIAPPWAAPLPSPGSLCPPQPLTSNLQPLVIVIQPSMGFGTGHHATTRLCLTALQELDLAGRDVLDVGTGSGVLAIAAVRLGAARAVGIDHDSDAIQAANENLSLNPDVQSVEFQVADLSTAQLAQADVGTANLTGATLIRSADRVVDLVRPAGVLIVSGLLENERDDVLRAFPDPAPLWERHEDGWVALAMKRS